MKIAICDDDKKIREYIHRIIKKELSNSKICLYDSAEQILSGNLDFDIYFLDIELGNISGMELARKIREKQDNSILRSIIIFVTGFREYMEEAFDVNAFHYLVKPLCDDKFTEVFKRAVRELSLNKKSRLKYIIVKDGNIKKKLYLNEIRYIESMDRKVIFHMEHGVTETYAKMYDLENMLGSSFFRCHRGYLVNFEKIIAYSSNSIQVQGGDDIILAEKKYPDFVKAYLRYAKNGGIVNV